MVPGYVERVVIGIDNFIVKEIESRVPHAERPAICSGHNLQKFAYCVLTSVHHNEASDIFWPAKTLDVDLQALVDRWEVPLPQALQRARGHEDSHGGHHRREVAGEQVSYQARVPEFDRIA